MISKKVCHQAVDHYGAADQIKQAVEELTELSLALQHYQKEKASLWDVAGEIADVQIMCEQLSYMFGPALVERAADIKIERLQRRMSE